MKRLLAGIALLPALCPSVQAQVHSIDQTARFTLKPPVRMTLLRLPARTSRSALLRLANTIPARDEAAILFSVTRQTLQFSQQRENGTRAAMPLAGHLSRTRVRSIRIDGTVPVDDAVSLYLGWTGAKYSNRNANVTAAYSDANLRAKDWFQPHGALHWSAAQNLLLRASYDESLLAYADIGMSGPLAMAREDFRRFQAQLRPEHHRRMQVGADWTAIAGLRLSLDLYGGRLDDRLAFADGSALPVNRGTADLQGGVLSIAHRPTSAFDWAVRYNHARVDGLDGGATQERRLSAEAGWQTGPWRASLRAARTSRPALFLPGDIDNRPLRLSAAINCQPPAMPGLTLGLRLADPDRLASSAFTATDTARGLRAQDQARSLLLSANLVW